MNKGNTSKYETGDILKFNNKLIIDAISNMNLENVEKFKEVYYLKYDINSFNEDSKNLDIAEKFLYNYLYRARLLNDISPNYFDMFVKWHMDKGKDYLILFINKINNCDINTNKLIKTFLRYELLLEQSIYEKNEDSLLNLLIDIPKNINKSC